MAVLSLKNVSYDFGTHWALKNISFYLHKGDFLFLKGPSGAGKTTLLRLLLGDLPLHRGQAFVCGFDMKNIKPREIPSLRREVGVVFQDFKILGRRSVFANVALALEVRGMSRQKIERRVTAILRAMDLDKKSHFPCQELSGGEQQRVAVARAVVVNPKILFADEPTGNLDKELALRLISIFNQFNAHGTTIILATHNAEIIKGQKDAKILSLKDGEIADANWPTNQESPSADRPEIHQEEGIEDV